MTGAPHPATRHDEVGRRVPAGVTALGEFTYSVVEIIPAQKPGQAARSKPTGERRGEGRTPSRLREGLVNERRGKVLVDCRIRDMSKRGARLQLDKDRPLPKAFLLTEAGTGRAFWATLAWQVGRDAGVRLKPVD